jgi:hypothetical protein
MRSHDLARRLLARRDNDIQVEVVVSEDPKSDDDKLSRTELRDSREVEGVSPDEVLAYDSQHDFLVIRAGLVVAGREGGAMLSPEEVRLVHAALSHILDQAVWIPPKIQAAQRLLDRLA